MARRMTRLIGPNVSRGIARAGHALAVREQRHHDLGPVEQHVVDGPADVGSDLLVEEVLELERSGALGWRRPDTAPIWASAARARR